MPINLQPVRLHHRAKGQVLIVLLAFSAVLCAALLSLYNVIQISTRKQRLTNAADAAAYSGATVLAQSLNYMAYTNRAIMLNASMMGQMQGIRSSLAMSHWYWKNTRNAAKVVESLASLLPGGKAIVTPVTTPLQKFADIWGDKLVWTMRGLAEALEMTSNMTLSLTNQIMWGAQQIQLAQNIAIFEPSVIEVAKKNAPDAKIDDSLALIAGAMVSAGTMYKTIHPMARSKKRTQGENEGKYDDYLQYFAEANHMGWLPANVATRTYLPNAVGLYIAKGCNAPMVDMLSGAFVPPAGLGALDQVLSGMAVAKGLLSPLANKMMCLYQRGGGTELYQDKHGRMAWASIDTMAFHWTGLVDLLLGSEMTQENDGLSINQILDLLLNALQIPTHIGFAGGSVASFSEKPDAKGKPPESLDHLIQSMQQNKLGYRSADYSKNPMHNLDTHFGLKVNLEPDCVEQLIGDHMYAASPSTRVDNTPCVVLATGNKDMEKSGLFSQYTHLGSAAKQTLQGTPLTTAQNPIDTIASNLAGQLSAAGDKIEAQMADTPLGASAGARQAFGNMMPAGIDGDAGSATVGGMNTALLASKGSQFKSMMAGIGSKAQGMMTGALSSLQISPSALLGPLSSPSNLIQGLMSTGDTSQSPATNSLGWLVDLVLKALGLDDLKDGLSALISGSISDGVEVPRNAAINNTLRALSMGFPMWFWDVPVKEEPSQRILNKYDFIVTDDDKKDYHPRRYGLGPIVYAPLIQSNDTIETAANQGIGGSHFGLPDFANHRNGMKAIGKARVYYRQPGEQWQNRYKYMFLANTLTPFWSVRNESLSYAEKMAILAIDGLQSMEVAP